jgi:mRNA-degrading endonuclease RelE of RelBE toxin-antitoxin system
MVFIEITSFTGDLKRLLSDDEYRAFQQHLADNPAAGDVIQGTGGLRKVRWAQVGRGKSGGVRVIYHWVPKAHHIRLLMIYPKSMKADLSKAEKAALKKIVERWNG